jgi:imidazolonepropionase-like amidohydrolase
VGSQPFLAVDLRNTINEGSIPGPRVVASGPGISITGGHGDLNNFSPQTSVSMFPEERNFQIADDANQIRHVMRAQVKYGVDVIKILATGGVLSKGDSPGAPQFTFEELKAAADTAHMAGRKIAAHAHGTEGIKNAILAGIDSIEHANLIDDEGIRLAKERGTYLVMDIYNDDYFLNVAPKVGLPQENIEKEKMVGRLQRENFEKAVKAGVKMGRTSAEWEILESGYFYCCLTALQAVRYRYGQVTASLAPPRTCRRPGRTQTHAPWLSLGTYYQMQQAWLRVRRRS